MAATPKNYLPGSIPSQAIVQLMTSVGLPAPKKVESYAATAEFHSIYLVHFDAAAGPVLKGARAEADGSIVLVLRVSGHHLPRLKTLNEVGMMAWVRDNTNIPVPAVIRFDASVDNPIAHEFTLLERAAGESVDRIYHTLGDETKDDLVGQLTDYVIQLHSKSWETNYVGGLMPTDGGVSGGPLIEETFWFLPDVRRYWGTAETLGSINPLSGPFDGCVSYSTACLERYIHAIQIHPLLAGYRDMIPKIQAFISTINRPTYTAKIDQGKYVVAHRDMHFANIMAEPADDGIHYKITAVLDWEFAGVVSSARWNPRKAFLWIGQQSTQAKEEQGRLWQVFERKCREKNAGRLLQEFELNKLQETTHTVVSYIRAIVEVCPKGVWEDLQRAEAWRKVAEAAMTAEIDEK